MTSGRLFSLSLLLMILALALGLIGPRTLESLPDGFTKPVLALELVSTPADFEHMKNEPASAPKADHAGSLYWRNTWVDFAFIACYACLWTAIVLRESRTVAVFGTMLVLAGALADVSEDVGILLGLRASTVSIDIVRLVRWSALVKWGVLGVAFGVLAYSFRPTRNLRDGWQWWRAGISLAYASAGTLCLLGVFGSGPLIEWATPLLGAASLLQTVLFWRQWRQQKRPIGVAFVSDKWLTTAFPEELAILRQRHVGPEPIEENLVGLAFSGGGIRSATFGLGVLEGLKHLGLLSTIDYLSTVSGGGYIGAWLSANCRRAADRAEAAQTRGEAPEAAWLAPEANWKESVAHLRRYSNYLSPVVGFFSADTWSMATIWLRNTLLVQLTVIFGIAVALLAPRPLFVVFRRWPQVGNLRWATILLFILAVVGIAGNQWRLNRHGNIPLLEGKFWYRGLVGATICLALALGIGVGFHFRPFDGPVDEPIDYRLAGPIGFLLVLAGFFLQPVAVRLFDAFRHSRGESPFEEVNYTQGWVQAVVVMPMMITGLLVAAILWGQSQGAGELANSETFGAFFLAAWRYWPFPLSVVFVSLWLLSLFGVRKWDWQGLLAAALAPLPAMLVLHLLLSAIMLLLHGWSTKGSEGAWLAFVWTPSLVLFSFALSVVMLIGMLGRRSAEDVREWWSRLGAWLGIYGVAWMVLSLATVYGALVCATLLNTDTWKGLWVGGGWIGTTLAGLLAGKSGSTGGTESKGLGAKVMEVVAAVAPFVFIAGLLVAVSTVLHLIITSNSGVHWNGVAELQTQHWILLTCAKPCVTMAVLAMSFVGLVILAWRVDINEFSLNAFYRSRLIRCYLGATRFGAGERHPQNFTGFDDDDDLRLTDLVGPTRTPAGPLHIINCSLNLGGSSDLALHTRHSAEFTLTPLRCGSGYPSRDRAGKPHELGYVPTETFGGRDGQPSLGQAISVSGAAASPNMGYHTSPVVAFLMTLFNARLGWWFPNPSIGGINSPSPSFSLRYLLQDLFGGADDKSQYLSISDGGHFENLAAYELVKRKCRVIVISDGECDPHLRFEGLGTLIRMCEVDFNVCITIDVGSIRPVGESPWSKSRCAVGRIAYPDAPEGMLIYLKASMTGNEDTSVLQYHATHSTFPHETTGDQFYGEDQFESYRTLGHDIAKRTFAPLANERGLLEEDVVGASRKLEKIWSPTLHSAAHFTQNSGRLMDLWSELAGNPVFSSLDHELVDSWPAESSPSFRSVFYLCSEMIQLMENAYLDLDLDNTWDHPDNEGWRVMFNNWAHSNAIQRTWALTSETFGLRFQYFCHRRLRLPLSKKAST